MLVPSRRERSTQTLARACCSGPAQLARGRATIAVSSGALRSSAMRSWSIERGDALQQTWGHDACCAERVSRDIRLTWWVEGFERESKAGWHSLL
jgi:hypothetical protein